MPPCGLRFALPCHWLIEIVSAWTTMSFMFSKWFDFIRLIFGKNCFKRHTWDWDFDIWLVGAAVFRQRTNVQKLILHRSLTSFLPFRQRLWHCDMMSAQLTFEIFKFHRVRFHLSFQWLLMMLCDLCLWSLAVNTQWLQRPGSYFSFTSSSHGNCVHMEWM